MRLWHWSERARLTMRPFTEAFVDAYLARAGEAVCASVGAYQLEGLGAHLFSRSKATTSPSSACRCCRCCPSWRSTASAWSRRHEPLRHAARRSARPAVRRIVGWPVEHSRSPALHGFWLKQHGIDGHYGRLPVEPNRAALEELVAFLRRTPNARGCNLTLPHKIEIMPLLDRIDPLARRTSAR